MIESLAEHGVRAEDLVPALMTTHTVKNPEYDPKAAKEAEAGEGKQEDSGETDYRSEEEAPPPYEPSTIPPISTPPSSTSDTAGETTPKTSIAPLPPLESRHKSINPFGDDDEEDFSEPPTHASTRIQSPPTSTLPQRKKSMNPFGSDDEDDGLPSFASSSRRRTSPARPSVARIPSFDMEDDEGDIGRPASPVAAKEPRTTTPVDDVPSVLDYTETLPEARDADPERTPTREHHKLPDDLDQTPVDSKEEVEEEPPSLPSLPGVSTSLTTADENVVLDIRWTVVSSNSPHDGRS
jgi:hypothetical protein